MHELSTLNHAAGPTRYQPASDESSDDMEFDDTSEEAGEGNRGRRKAPMAEKAAKGLGKKGRKSGE